MSFGKTRTNYGGFKKIVKTHLKMKKIANGILADNPEENAVFMTEDGQGFFDPIKANNHANKNELSEPEAFYREGYEPEDVRALEEQLGFAQEENETLTGIIVQIEQAVDFTQEAPEVTQESNSVVAAVVQLREKHQGSIALIDKVILALVEPEVVVDENAEPVVVEIMKLRASLKTFKEEKLALKEAISINSQSITDTIKAAFIEVKEETTATPKVPIAPKKAK